MAIYFTNTASWYRRTTNLPSITSFTIMGWAYVLALPASYSTFFQFGNVGPDDDYEISITSTGNLDIWNGSTNASSGAAMSINTWYHVACTVAGTGAGQALGYINGVLELTFNGGPDPTAVGFELSTSTGSVTNNFRMAAVKFYGAVLTAAEIVQEMRQYQPERTANLSGFWPLLSLADDEVDYAGVGNLTVNAVTLATAEGPPIPWSAHRRRHVYVPSALVASGDLNLRLDEPIIGQSSF